MLLNDGSLQNVKLDCETWFMVKSGSRNFEIVKGMNSAF